MKGAIRCVLGFDGSLAGDLGSAKATRRRGMAEDHIHQTSETTGRDERLAASECFPCFYRRRP